MEQLIAQIKQVFATDEKLYYKNKLTDSDAQVCLASEISTFDYPYSIHWLDLLDNNAFLFSDIANWHENEIVFDYFLPASLIYCLNNQFNDKTFLLFYMARFEPSFYDFNECSYLPYLLGYSIMQRKTLADFFAVIEHSIGKTLFCNEIDSINQALDWLKKCDELKQKVESAFRTEQVLSYNEIADVSDLDNLPLCKKLAEQHWQSNVIGEYIDQILDTLEYYQLSCKAFIYFLPRCLLNSLTSYPGRGRSVTPDHVLNLLCGVIDENSLNPYYKALYAELSLTQKQIIIEFLNLYWDTPYYRAYDKKREKISNALSLFWLTVV